MEKNKRYCLIVEDNEISGFVYSEHLRTMGFLTNHMTDASLALALCADTMPDVILLDWHMPRLNGEGFLVRLRELEGGDNVMVIVCTCNDYAAVSPVFKDLNVAGFLSKPTYHDHLQRKFKELGLLDKVA